jgi:transglutaminase-like putative cysteine protease
VTESVMEARMQPRSDAGQRCLHFALTTMPSSRVLMYQDHEGNLVHHFDIPGRHARLIVTAESLVERDEPVPLPSALGADAWTRLDAMTATGEYWDALRPSTFAHPSALLAGFAAEVGLGRDADPLQTVRRLSEAIFARFTYSPDSTHVDSPIDDALGTRKGVCQDFAHVLIALLRQMGVPARYVSGYLFHRKDGEDRSADGATHAWVEALMPELGWVGVDPTNNLVTGTRHIRVAVGRDYADVPPTRGVFKGHSAVRSELAVGVRVGPVSSSLPGDPTPFVPWISHETSGVSLTVAPGEAAAQQQ